MRKTPLCSLSQTSLGYEEDEQFIRMALTVVDANFFKRNRIYKGDEPVFYRYPQQKRTETQNKCGV